jgi:hypothetical protein
MDKSVLARWQEHAFKILLTFIWDSSYECLLNDIGRNLQYDITFKALFNKLLSLNKRAYIYVLYV